jgi:hypothetical protein
MTISHDRRSFLRRSSLLTSAAILAPSLGGLVACAEPTASGYDLNGIRRRQAPAGQGGYGRIRVYEALPEISLPAGFHAARISTRGDIMDDGNVVPQASDGMAAFGMGERSVRLVRNHEIRNTATDPNRRAIASGSRYDDLGPAGTTTLEVDVKPNGEATLRRQFASLAGTFVNCAGGPTPWGSWITCEETVAGTNAGWKRNHGYNFEVPAFGDGLADPVPLRAMGRFVHEAIAVDPSTGIVYETEDRNPGGFYRFIPNQPGRLAAGGTLQVLVVKGRPQYETRVGQRVGEVLEVEWATIPNPDSDAPSISSGFVFNQVAAAARFGRLEGCWWGDAGCYFTATSGGNAGAGQVFKYTPTSADGGELVLVFESPSVQVLNSPDNITISPRGGIVICEDGDGANYVRGITPRGEVFDIVRNNVSGSEWAGACWAPQGRTLFVNMQGSTLAEGTALSGTYAIWGPWESGCL